VFVDVDFAAAFVPLRTRQSCVTVRIALVDGTADMPRLAASAQAML
jgi:hypothetical protein